MALVQVVSDDGRTVVEIGEDDALGTVALCTGCGERISDRGHFEDTVQAAQVHVDQRH